MARDGAGTYTFPVNSFNPAVAATDISPTDWNSTAADLATAMSASIAKDGQTAITADIPLNGHKLTGVAAATTSGDALTYAGAGNFAGLVGTTTNDSAATGRVGEYLSSTIVSGSAVSLSSSVTANLTSISLTAGDWDVSFTSLFNGGGAASVSRLISSISQTSATTDTTPGSSQDAGFAPASTIFGVANPTQNVGPVRVSLASTTTIYAVAVAGFSGVANIQVWGVLRARRAR